MTSHRSAYSSRRRVSASCCCPQNRPKTVCLIRCSPVQNERCNEGNPNQVNCDAHEGEIVVRCCDVSAEIFSSMFEPAAAIGCGSSGG